MAYSEGDPELIRESKGYTGSPTVRSVSPETGGGQHIPQVNTQREVSQKGILRATQPTGTWVSGMQPVRSQCLVFPLPFCSLGWLRCPAKPLDAQHTYESGSCAEPEAAGLRGASLSRTGVLLSPAQPYQSCPAPASSPLQRKNLNNSVVGSQNLPISIL